MTNVCAVTMMTRLIVNDMKQRKKGVIVNVGSGTHLQPAPFACVYAATKVRLFTSPFIPFVWVHHWTAQRKFSSFFELFHIRFNVKTCDSLVGDILAVDFSFSRFLN